MHVVPSQRGKLPMKGANLGGGEKEMVARKALHADRVADGGSKTLSRGELSFCDFVGAGKMTVLQEVQNFFDNRPESPQHRDRKVKVRSRRSLTRAKPGSLGGSEFQIRFDADEKDDVVWDEAEPVEEDGPVTGEFPFRWLSSGQREKSVSTATVSVEGAMNNLRGEGFCASQHERNVWPIPTMQEADCFGGLQRCEDIVALSRVVDMESLFARQSKVEDSQRTIQRSPELMDVEIDDHVPLPQGLWNIYSGLCRSQRLAKAHGSRLGGADVDRRETGEDAFDRTTLVRSLRADFEDPEDNAIKNTDTDMMEGELGENEEIDTRQKDSGQVEDCSVGEQKRKESREHGESPDLRPTEPSATPIGAQGQQGSSDEATVKVPDIFSLASGVARTEELQAQVGNVTPNHDLVDEHAPSCIQEQLCSVKSRRKNRSEQMEKDKGQVPVISGSGKSGEWQTPTRQEVDDEQKQIEVDEGGATPPDLGASGGLGFPETAAGQVDRNDASVPAGKLPNEIGKDPYAEPDQNVLDGNTLSKDTVPPRDKGKRKRKMVERRKSLVGAGSKWEDGRRRSTRVRVPPVEWWNNEKLLYGRVSESLCTLVGIKKLLPPTPPVGRRQHEKRQKFEIKSFVSPRWKNLVDFVAL